IIGHPDRMSAKDLHDRAWDIVSPHFDEAQKKLAALYHKLAGTGRTANDVSAVVTAAYQGQIQHLFVAHNREMWGSFDPSGPHVTVHETAQAGDEDLLNLAAAYTLTHKGSVYAVEPDLVPGSTPLAAIFWLPV